MILAVGSAIHDNDINGAFVSEICHPHERTKGIRSVRSHGFVLPEYDAAGGSPTLKVGCIHRRVADPSLEDRLIVGGLLRGVTGYSKG